MELVRIIEKDDKTARDKIKKIYGNDCLIVSSSRIKNKSELVIAIDLDNQVDNIFLQKNDVCRKIQKIVKFSKYVIRMFFVIDLLLRFNKTKLIVEIVIIKQM